MPDKPDLCGDEEGVGLETTAAELLANLTGPDEGLRKQAAFALGSCGPEDRDAVPELVHGVLHGNPTARFWAAVALGRIGPDAAQGVPALVALLDDMAFGTRSTAARALAQIGQPAAADAVPAVIRLFKRDDNKTVRENSLRALGELGVHSDEAITALIEALSDPDVDLRRGAAIALKVLEGRARPALPTLTRIAEDQHEDERVRGQASAAIRIIDGADDGRS
jgi:HEAT repeat protein